MKTILILLSVILFGCYESENKVHGFFTEYPKEEKESIKTNTSPSDWNKSKNEFINGLLNSEPVFVKKEDRFDGWSVQIQYPDYRITVYYSPEIPFECKETWDFFCSKKDGSLIQIQSYFNVSENKLSPATYERIKQICLNIK